MIFNNFKLHATPYITDAYCSCGTTLKEVSNGMLSIAMYCPKCESVYMLELRKLPTKKVTNEFIEQCRKEIKK